MRKEMLSKREKKDSTKLPPIITSISYFVNSLSLPIICVTV